MKCGRRPITWILLDTLNPKYITLIEEKTKQSWFAASIGLIYLKQGQKSAVVKISESGYDGISTRAMSRFGELQLAHLRPLQRRRKTRSVDARALSRLFSSLVVLRLISASIFEIYDW